MKSPVTFSVCKTCEASYVADAAPAEDFERLAHIESPEQLAEFRPTTTDVTHLMNVDEVIGEYGFREKVKCSFDEHRHQVGYLVRTRCGLVLQLGGTCAGKTIANFRLVKARLDDRRAYWRFLDVEREESSRMREQFERISATETYLGDLWDALNGARALRREASLEFSLWRTGNADRLRDVGPDLRQLLGWLDQWRNPPPLGEQRRYTKQRKAMQARLDALANLVAKPAQLLSRTGMQRFILGLESEETQVRVERFDPLRGHEVVRYEVRSVRVSHRWDTTDSGIVDHASGRVLPFAWRIIAASEAA
jgi:hypothetical protein